MKKKNINLTTDLLIEIGAEELPVAFVEKLPQQLEHVGAAFCGEHRLGYDRITGWATPLRAVMHITGLSLKQPDEKRHIRGPRYDSAFDAEGNPTPQALGFARSQGCTHEEFRIEKTPKGNYVSITKEIKGLTARQIITTGLPRLISMLDYPVQMRWPHAEIMFPRPIRWCCVLLNNKALRISLGNVLSGGATVVWSAGHRRKITVTSAGDYFKVIRQAGIVLESAKRTAFIRKELAKNAEKYNAKLVPNDDLVTEVSHLTEQPKTITGSFAKRYLDLPAEVLISSMSKHQRLFTMRTSGGKKTLVPYFIGFVNGARKDRRGITANVEHVLEARLDDSLFFYAEDRKTSLEQKTSLLKPLVFHASLGSMYEKAERLQQLVGTVTAVIPAVADQRDVFMRAAFLAKADLVTSMVKEFPSLQGVMGRYYALVDGELDVVATAIGEQYLPRTATDVPPRSVMGAVLALSDKLDTLIGYFGAGFIPSGSLDPYGLRRAGSGIIAIIIAHKLRLSLSEIITASIALYAKKIDTDQASWHQSVMTFLKERLEAYLLQRYDADLINAVLSSGYDDIGHVIQRLEALTKIIKKPVFQQACKVAERTKNISKNAVDLPPVTEAIFTEEIERELWQTYGDMCGTIGPVLAAEDYGLATCLYGKGFYDILHRFFDVVLVNVDDVMLRNNRLAMIRAIYELYAHPVADLSQLVTSTKEE